MSQFLEQPALFDQLVRLGKEERRDPMRVLEQFFSDYRLHECRHILWSMVEACLTTDHSEFCEPEERANLLLRYEHLEKVVEASYLLAGAGAGAEMEWQVGSDDEEEIPGEEADGPEVEMKEE